MRKFLLLIVISLSVLACQDTAKLSPITPDSSGHFPEKDKNDTRAALAAWSSYINVHSTAEAMNTYRDSLTLLKKAGKLQTVRVGIVKEEGFNNPVIKMIGSLGIELLALIDNKYLTEPNIEQTIDQAFNAYPEIQYFQIGNEITTINGGHMSAEQYATVFNRVYQHVQNRYPGKTLLTYSFLGSGQRGPVELQTVYNLALKFTDPNRVIIAINCYDPDNLNGEYLGVLNGPLRPYRVWITETGIDNSDQQISYVQNNYPKLRDYLRAERIYWYALWTGDGEYGAETGFGLIRYPGKYPDYWRSPLFKLLTGTN